MKILFVWNKAALKKRRRSLVEAQSYIDRNCIEKMTPYVPVGRDEFSKSGKLRDSAKIAEPGKIVYTAAFAKSDYYAVKRHKPPYGGNPNGERLWFEVMKIRHGSDILRGAARITGGKAK